jgi:hypothetical protein
MGIYRHQFSGVMALPVKVKKNDFHSGVLNLNDAYYLLIDNLKNPVLAQYATKALVKKLRKTEQELAGIASPDITYGVTINGVTGVSVEVPHGTVPEAINYTDTQFEDLEAAMQNQIGIVEEMISILLGQPIKFQTERKINFEYWI